MSPKPQFWLCSRAVADRGKCNTIFHNINEVLVEWTRWIGRLSFIFRQTLLIYQPLEVKGPKYCNSFYNSRYIVWMYYVKPIVTLITFVCSMVLQADMSFHNLDRYSCLIFIWLTLLLNWMMAGEGKAVDGTKSSSENHHGESPFSNSDSVGSFPDKPTDFTTAYSQLYQR